MTDDTLPRIAAMAQDGKRQYIHPHPDMIRAHIERALAADFHDPATPYVPVHVLGLVQDAVTAACAEWDGGE